jgi:TPR repeat protein
MCLLTRATAAGLFVFALAFAASAQLPTQAPAQAAQDDDLASLRQQAAAGDAAAQFALGNRYFRGVGVLQDYARALTWYRKSASQGFAPARKPNACVKN